METLTVDSLTLFFDPAERDTAELVQDTYKKTIRLMWEHWGLETPREVRVYVMTSWLHFLFHSAPWYWQPLLVMSLPFWYFRVKNLWRFTGGWAQSYGTRRAIGVKPPRLIQLADKSLGERLFIKEDSADEKTRHITCHELTHAFTAHLQLPMWLNEGLAMLSVDRLLQRQTVKTETLDILAQSGRSNNLKQVGAITQNNQDAVIALYVRGYWIARYFEDVRPGLLKSLLAQRHSHRALEGTIAGSLDMDRKAFWDSIDGMVASYFREPIGQ